jgi:hypothetical protein
LVNIELEISQNATKHFPHGTFNKEMLAKLQHYGGNTDFVDFSKNIYIVLFFTFHGESNTDSYL